MKVWRLVKDIFKVSEKNEDVIENQDAESSVDIDYNDTMDTLESGFSDSEINYQEDSSSVGNNESGDTNGENFNSQNEDDRYDDTDFTGQQENNGDDASGELDDSSSQDTSNENVQSKSEVESSLPSDDASDELSDSSSQDTSSENAQSKSEVESSLPSDDASYELSDSSQDTSSENAQSKSEAESSLPSDDASNEETTSFQNDSGGDEDIEDTLQQESDSETVQNNHHKRDFFDKIRELPSFKNRLKGNSYAISAGTISVSDSTIRTLINKFLNQRFCINISDLNHRATSLEKTDGFYKWKVKEVIVHLETNQLTKVLTDKYGYDYQNGQNQQVPLSFYFDLSGSMSSYSNLLAVMAVELLKKDVKVLVGFNECVNVQIDEIDKSLDFSSFTNFLISAGYMNDADDIRQDPKIKYKLINEDLDNYLITRKAEKCVVFSDCDPINEIITLSNYAQVYWFCFEKGLSIKNLDNFKGFAYQVQDEKTIQKGLVEVNTNNFKTLCRIKKGGI